MPQRECHHILVTSVDDSAILLSSYVQMKAQGLLGLVFRLRGGGLPGMVSHTYNPSIWEVETGGKAGLLKSKS